MSNKVFFLGAGFSIAVAKMCTGDTAQPYPSLKELSHSIASDFAYSKNSLEAHLNEISPKYKNDIEQLLTYLSSDLPWKTPQMQYLDKALYFELINKIRQHFEQLDRDNEYDFSSVATLANFIIKNQCPIITLNYDTLLEQLIFSQMPTEYQTANTYRGFYKQAIVDIFSRVPRSAFGFASGDTDHFGKKLPNIHKLHGSINWLWSATNPSDTIYCSCGKKFQDVCKDLNAYIIPPVLDKTKFYSHNILKSIWNDAHKCLSIADEIYIIGFSFPMTDLSVKFLFNSVGLKHEMKHPKIYVVNTRDSIDAGNKSAYIKDRYNDLFEGYDISYDYCCDNSLSKFIKDIIEPQLESVSTASLA